MPFQKGHHPKTEFQPGQSGNPNGAPRKLDRALKAIPRDDRVKVLKVLHHALALPNVAMARRYMEEQEAELGEYGFLMQIAVRQMAGKNGWFTVSDILDRIYGKPRQQAEIKMEGPTVIMVPEKAQAALDKWKKKKE